MLIFSVGFEGRSCLSCTCELFPPNFPSWTDPSKLQLMRWVQHAWDVQGLLWFLTCSTLEMEAKELLKISSLCYCLLHLKALGSHRGCWACHPMEVQLDLGHTSAVMPLYYSYGSCPIQNNNSLYFQSWFKSLWGYIAMPTYSRTIFWYRGLSTCAFGALMVMVGRGVSDWTKNGSFGSWWFLYLYFIEPNIGIKELHLQWAFITVFLPAVPLLPTSCEGIKNIESVLKYIFFFKERKLKMHWNYCSA